MSFARSFRNDLPASVVVFFVAVPLCLGIALASGAPPISGLIAGIIGGLIVGTLSKSPLGVSGPAAGLAVIVYNLIGDLGFEPFLLAVVISGALQIVMGFAGAGVLAYFFPSSVIRGMLAGIGLIIVLKQIPHSFGYDKDPEGEVSYNQPDGETTFSELGRMFEAIELNAVFVSMTCLAILILWDRVLSKKHRVFQIVQGPLVAVVFGIVYQLATSAFSGEHLVNVPVTNSLKEMTDLLVLPDWAGISQPAVWMGGITIAVVGSLETLLCLDATDKLDPQKRVTPANRELLAQGSGNMISGLIGGLPITQVIVRSSANIQSGAESKLSAILHGLFMLLFVVFLPFVLNLVPKSVLAAILLVVGFKLATPKLFKSMFAKGFEQFIPFIVTIAGIVFTDLLTGIGLGMVCAVIVILRRSYLNSHFMHMVKDNVSGRNTVRMTLAEEVTFLNRGAILRELSRLPDGSKITVDMSRSYNVDGDVIEIVEDFAQNAKDRDIDVEVIPPTSQLEGTAQSAS